MDQAESTLFALKVGTATCAADTATSSAEVKTNSPLIVSHFFRGRQPNRLVSTLTART